MSLNDSLTKLFQRTESKGSTGSILWRMRSDDGTLDFSFGDLEQPFFIASATKLFVTAILAQLRSENRVDWDSPLADYLLDLDISGLVVEGGIDITRAVTIREVMSHTSGLGDYFEGKRADGSTTIQRAIEGDFSWRVGDVVEWTKLVKPGKRGKGLYSDTGYQLLGAVIEHIEGAPFAEVVSKRITAPLGLSSTFVFTDADIARYDEVAVMFNGTVPLRIPRAMASVQADGGIVSTVKDALAFCDAFFGGRLFPREFLDEMLTDWHPIFPPFEYGTGVMRFSLPSFFTGFRKLPELVGHSGASGTVMFRSEKLGVTVVGTVNQIQKRSLPFELMVRALLLFSKR